MSDESFAALDAIIQQEVDVVSSLADENARLRALLAAQSAPAVAPPVQLDPAVLLAELQATKAAQDELFRELKAMKEAQSAVARVEDQSDEVALLRESLADLANQLDSEKKRVSALERQRREEEEKVTTLRSKVEESRRAVMRLQNESSAKRSAGPPPSMFDSGYSFPPRRGSFVITAPRRRSSLGLAAITGSPRSPPSDEEEGSSPSAAPQPLGFGLGLGVPSPTTASFPLSSSPSSTSKATPLARFAHRRGSQSLSFGPSGSSEEDDRMARLRDLKLGTMSTKVHSRRNSAATGLPEFATPFDWDLERRFARRMSAASSAAGSRGGRNHRSSISEQGESDDASWSSSNGPPSANFRMLGRKDSMAMFESWSRRSSTASSVGGWPAGSDYNPDCAVADHLQDLQLQLQGLRIQLAESEEGRRASELCLTALKAFIAQSNPEGAPLPISLPPLPSDSSADVLCDVESSSSSPRRAPPSRWSISRLSLSSRRESANTPQASSSYEFPPSSSTRRTSTSSSMNASSSVSSGCEKSTPSLPSFGSFSFSALTSSRPTSLVLVDADASPKMASPPTLLSTSEFPVDPSPLLPSSRSRGGSADASSSSPAADEETDAEAPSLVSDLSSRGSSRASSPEIEDEFEDSPRVVVDFVDDDLLVGEGEELVSAARVPVAKGSLRTVSGKQVRASPVAAQPTGLGLMA
ncbi:hypothetical protein JCM8547_006433 [Rhodosporidiobolus lusitaniae]